MPKVQMIAKQLVAKFIDGETASNSEVSRYYGHSSYNLSRIFPEEKFSEKELRVVVSFACKYYMSDRVDELWDSKVRKIINFGTSFNIPLFVEFLQSTYSNDKNMMMVVDSALRRALWDASRNYHQIDEFEMLNDE